MYQKEQKIKQFHFDLCEKWLNSFFVLQKENIKQFFFVFGENIFFLFNEKR